VRIRSLFMRLVSGLALVPALAFQAGAFEPSDFAVVDCDGSGDCVVVVAPGLGLLAPEPAFIPHADGLGFDVVGDVSIPTGGEPVTLLESDLSIRLDPSGSRVAELVGVTRMPMPNDGFLGPVEITERPLASMGFAQGAVLLQLEGPVADAPIREDRFYFFFNAVARFAAELPPISMQTPGGAGVVVLDPIDPFFYLAGEYEGFGGDGKEQDDSSQTAAADPADPSASSSPDPNAADPNATDPNANDPNASDPQDDEDDDGAGLAGIGFSVNGLIPFVPARVDGVEDEMPIFDGHLYLATSMPLAPLPISASGEFVFDLDPDDDGDTPFTPVAFAASPDLAYGVNGALDVEIPFLKFFSIGFPLGDATAAVKVDGADVRAAFSGLVTADEFMPDLPLPIRPTGGIRVYGAISAKNPVDFFAHAEGQMGIDAGGLGALSGVPLGELYSQDAVLDVNASGLTVQGSTSASIHPSIALDGSAGFIMFLSPAGDANLGIFGAFTIGTEHLENAALIVGTDGVRVYGEYTTGGTRLWMTGVLDGSGYSLSGSAKLADPIEGNAQEKLALVNSLLAQQVLVDALRFSADAADAIVSSLLPPVQAARDAVAVAQSAVNGINSDISYQTGRMNSYYSSYTYWKKKSCAWYDASCQTNRAAKMSYYYGKYTYHKGVRAALYVSRDAALAVLGAASSSLALAEGNLSSAQAIANLAQAELDHAIAALRDAEAQLAALPEIDGTLDMIATITISNGVVSGSVQGVWNGQPLTDGWVRFGSPGEACLQVPTVGTICSPL